MGEEVKTVWQSLYEHLSKEGFEVYSPGQHKGACLSQYVVIKDEGSTRMTTISTDLCLYDVMCYVPMDRFSTLEPFVAKVKESLKKLFPLVKPTGYQTPSYLDDTNDSYMISIQYSNYKKVYYN